MQPVNASWQQECATKGWIDTHQGPWRPGHALCHIVCTAWQSWHGALITTLCTAHKLKTWSSCMNMKQRANLDKRFFVQLVSFIAPHQTKVHMQNTHFFVESSCVQHLILQSIGVAVSCSTNESVAAALFTVVNTTVYSLRSAWHSRAYFLVTIAAIQVMPACRRP